MPRSLARLLLACAIAIAVPIQGMAAVSAGLCMAFGHHEAPATTPDQGHHEHDSPAAHDHSGAPEQQNSHCGPCVACCASALIAGPAGITILSSPSNAKYVFSQSPPLGVQPDALDRPPLAL